MAFLPKMPIDWLTKVNPKVDYDALNNLVDEPKIDDIQWWLKILEEDKDVFSVMVLSLRNGFAVGFPTITYHMSKSLSNKLFSLKMLVIQFSTGWIHRK